jgi:hypothetical protein
MADYGETYQKLRSEVNKLDTGTGKKELPEIVNSEKGSGNLTTYFKSPFAYMVGAFVLLFLVLIIMRPRLVTVEVEGKDVRKLSPKKVLVWSIAFSAPLIFAIYFYVYRKKKDEAV